MKHSVSKLWVFAAPLYPPKYIEAAFGAAFSVTKGGRRILIDFYTICNIANKILVYESP